MTLGIWYRSLVYHATHATPWQERRLAMKGTIALPPGFVVSPSPVLSYICFKVELWLS